MCVYVGVSGSVKAEEAGVCVSVWLVREACLLRSGVERNACCGGTSVESTRKPKLHQQDDPTGAARAAVIMSITSFMVTGFHSIVNSGSAM
ncbi:hypothetical protein P153DRAFT_364915 [Dothidotthia symphoricarpi CBS 119687]|uniref:Uncharacterized protein n=1 Tax=Dothidotthia symphoricarpi CBS 119687 TaxID=1392245 RepID=A0A6A6AK72_9PLEO|nr:uncharacterized protein P153DRAFT_364915 [Dothidotthia symphoricarpi CBS 119687]KAF2131314.1 hypothetical protein P153DRAFT_364915 [Dothidotthia symphoricarpi CBS 119687]